MSGGRHLAVAQGTWGQSMRGAEHRPELRTYCIGGGQRVFDLTLFGGVRMNLSRIQQAYAWRRNGMLDCILMNTAIRPSEPFSTPLSLICRPAADLKPDWFGRGRVVILGDAAHPMRPTGQVRTLMHGWMHCHDGNVRGRCRALGWGHPMRPTGQVHTLLQGAPA